MNDAQDARAKAMPAEHWARLFSEEVAAHTETTKAYQELEWRYELLRGELDALLKTEVGEAWRTKLRTALDAVLAEGEAAPPDKVVRIGDVWTLDEGGGSVCALFTENQPVLWVAPGATMTAHALARSLRSSYPDDWAESVGVQIDGRARTASRKAVYAPARGR